MSRNGFRDDRVTISEQVKRALNSVPGGYARIRVLGDGGLTMEYVNDCFCRMCGMTKKELLSDEHKDVMPYVHPDDANLVDRFVDEVLTTDDVKSIQYRMRHANEAYIPLIVFCRRVKDEDGAVFINAFYAEMTKRDFQPESPQQHTPFVVRLGRKTKGRMLIVENNAAHSELLTDIFKDDFAIERVSDGKSALVCLRHYGTAISVVLLDLLMEGMDGFEVLDEICGNMDMRSIPVIVVSAVEDYEIGLQVIKHGASDFIPKPVDPDLIRIRVQSAISRAENEHLRAQNSYLMLQNDETNKYRIALESIGATVIEYHWLTGDFSYDSSISQYIAGNYDFRKLWHILLSDNVADVREVQAMQGLVHDIANDRARSSGSMTVTLRAPSKARHLFRMNVVKLANEYKLTDKIILVFNDLDAKEEKA